MDDFITDLTGKRYNLSAKLEVVDLSLRIVKVLHAVGGFTGGKAKKVIKAAKNDPADAHDLIMEVFQDYDPEWAMSVVESLISDFWELKDANDKLI